MLPPPTYWCDVTAVDLVTAFSFRANIFALNNFINSLTKFGGFLCFCTHTHTHVRHSGVMVRIPLEAWMRVGVCLRVSAGVGGLPFIP